MNQTPPDATRLAGAKKMSGILKHLAWPGVIGVILSFFENSPVWTFFIVLTTWLGVVIGLTGGPGLADHLLNKTPAHRRVSQRKWTMLSVGTFWIPTLATGMLGMVLTGGLREDLQPYSHVNDSVRNYLLLIVQSYSMYFVAAGVSWWVVGREVKAAQQSLETTEG